MNFDFFIIGLGQIGCSLALALKKFNIANKVYGMDKIFKAFYTEILDQYVNDLRKGIEKSEIIVIATPIREIVQLIRQIAPLLDSDKILIDTGSTKREILEEMKKFPERIIIGCHPMVGTVRKGREAINGELFVGKKFFLSFPHEYSRKGEEVINSIIKSIGAVPVEIDEANHDFYVSIVSHLPYVLSMALFSVYLKTYKKNKEIENFISSGFLGATRLALTDMFVGGDMILTNRDNIIKNLDRVIFELKRVKKKIKNGKFYDYIGLITQEAEKRRKIYENFMG